MLADPDTLSTLRTTLLQPRPDPPRRASDARVTSANRGTMLRCIIFYCETICKLDRLPEPCRWARACRAPAPLLQWLASGIEQYGDVEGYMIFVSARSNPTRKDGVLVALCMRTFARSEVTAIHEKARLWESVSRASVARRNWTCIWFLQTLLLYNLEMRTL